MRVGACLEGELVQHAGVLTSEDRGRCCEVAAVAATEQRQVPARPADCQVRSYVRCRERSAARNENCTAGWPKLRDLAQKL
jgi:hypothetical protein